ncbi:Tn3 family transposase [Streptosporangium sp. NPDC006013]|uniref:Tn3 family transposase n=1 Tax=Streptosporangium sp. NPDC006013 TaxID=3155596 RepID=UPI0033BA4FEC
MNLSLRRPSRAHQLHHLPAKLRRIVVRHSRLLLSGTRVPQRSGVHQTGSTPLLANLVIFHNALDLMDVVRILVAEGWTITADELGALSPYLRAYIRRFGAYATDEIGGKPAAFNPELKEIDFTAVELAA